MGYESFMFNVQRLNFKIFKNGSFRIEKKIIILRSIYFKNYYNIKSKCELQQ